MFSPKIWCKSIIRNAGIEYKSSREEDAPISEENHEICRENKKMSEKYNNL